MLTILACSGLDSTSSLAVMNALKAVAEKGRLTVMCVIHQPRYEIFSKYRMTSMNFLFAQFTSYIIHHFSGAPRGAFQQPVYNKYKVRWLRVLARPLQAVHIVFLSETLSCALS